MYTVSGKILLKETGQGIPDLMVTVLDYDNVSLSKGVTDLSNSKEATSVKAKAEAITNAQSQQLDYEKLPFQSMGTVLTDTDGRFVIEYEAAIFQQGEQDAAPDLLLVITAPEIVDDIKQVDAGEAEKQHLQKQLLALGLTNAYMYLLNQFTNRQVIHISKLFRPKAGHTEQFVVYLSQNVLDNFRILKFNPYTRQQQDTEAVISYFNDVTKSEIIAKRVVVQKAQTVLENFSLTNLLPEIRQSRNFVTNDSKAITDRQDQLIQQELQKSKSRFSELLVNEQSFTEKPRMTLTVDRSKPLSLNTPWLQKAINSLQPLIPTTSFWPTLSRISELSRPHSPLPICFDARLKTESLLLQIEGKPTPAEDNQPITGSALSPADVGQVVATQLRTATAPEEKLSYGIDRDNDVSGTISRFKLKGGPADVTSYHDFEQLKIAFEDVWTEVFDGFLQKQVQQFIQDSIRRGVYTETQGKIQTREDLFRIFEETYEPVPPYVGSMTGISKQDWNSIASTYRVEIAQLAFDVLNNLNSHRESTYEQGKREVQASIKARLNTNPITSVFKELYDRVNARYKFDVFAPDSVNYGLLLSYRQAWKPLNYQVGRLVKTLPLAPKETQKYSIKRIVKKNRIEKEIDESQQSRREEFSSTSREESEIVNRAKNATSFRMNAEGSVSIGVFGGNFSTGLENNAERESSSTKKNFREAVFKSAEEYKRQHRLEVETSHYDETEHISSGEISNPNDEITVTYLFYELQRTYEVRENLNTLTPVILVANEVPTPSDIDEDWIMAQSWILRRVLLDDSFLPALEYVNTGMIGEKLALEQLQNVMLSYSSLVYELTNELRVKNSIADSTFKELQRIVGLIQETASKEENQTAIMGMAFGPLGALFQGLFGGGNNQTTDKQEEIIRMGIERADNAQKEVSTKLVRETTNLREATEKYAKATQQYLEKQAEVSRLRVHLKDNILFYMQTIWDHENPDQRYFRLYNKKVKWFTAPDTDGLFRFKETRPGPTIAQEVDIYELTLPPPTQPGDRFLHEVADLDRILGYKGNYMIFPVKQTSYLHLYMMQDYLNPESITLRDPSDKFGFTSDELVQYIKYLHTHDSEVYQMQRDHLSKLLQERLCAEQNETQMIIVPTDSLYIEALPGSHPIMEDFKLTHRALDVKKVQAEVRMMELENARYAARILAEKLEDPSIEKQVTILGNDKDGLLPPTE